MRHFITTVFALLLTATHALAGDSGILRKSASAGVTETADALEAALTSAGLTIFARVDHGAGAKSIGADIGASELILFGNPKVGTPAMQDDPVAGLYLPMKVLIFEDPDGAAWIAYEDPVKSLSALGGIGADAPYLKVMQGALAKFTGALTN